MVSKQQEEYGVLGIQKVFEEAIVRSGGVGGCLEGHRDLFSILLKNDIRVTAEYVGDPVPNQAPMYG